MIVYRLEFLQPDGRWTGPYCSETLTLEAFAVRDRLIAGHTRDDVSRPWPDERIFLDSPREDRRVCGTTTMGALVRWFGSEFLPLIREGAHVGIYYVPELAIASMDGKQIIYMQRQAVLQQRYGVPIGADRLVWRAWQPRSG